MCLNVWRKVEKKNMISTHVFSGDIDSYHHHHNPTIYQQAFGELRMQHEIVVMKIYCFVVGTRK
jgi:hypothetical protein